MIPPEEEQKTLIESFMEGLPCPVCDRESQFRKMLNALFSDACKSVNSYDEWHGHLSSYDIILVRARNSREIYKERWHSWAQGRFFILKNPAEKDNNEMMLVPHKTVEKMILLGMLK